MSKKEFLIGRVKLNKSGKGILVVSEDENISCQKERCLRFFQMTK